MNVRHTNDTLFEFFWSQMEDILLGSEIGLIRCFDIQDEPFDKWATVSCSSVGIRIPRFFFDHHRTGGQNRFEPSWEMTFDMIDFERVLTIATGSIGIGLIFNNFHATACSIGFFATFSLKKDEDRLCVRSNPRRKSNLRSNQSTESTRCPEKRIFF